MFSLDPAQFDNCSKKGSTRWCKEMLAKYDGGASTDGYLIVTADDSCIYAYEPETTLALWTNIHTFKTKQRQDNFTKMDFLNHAG